MQRPKIEILEVLAIGLSMALFTSCSNSNFESLSSHAQLTEPWNNKAIIDENKEAPRAAFLSQAFNSETGETVGVPNLSLNGRWKFSWVSSPLERPVGFYNVEFDDGDWQEISVPSVWERQGFGYPVYANVEYPFIADPFEVPVDHQNHVGSYRKEFQLPDDWLGGRVFVEFGAVSSALTLWVNGERVGYAQGSRTPLEFDITEYVTPGTNLIAAQVMRWNDGSWLENQDSWSLSGIFRDVTLISRPNTHIRDFFASTSLENDYRDGVLDLSVELRGFGQTDLGRYKVEYRLSRDGVDKAGGRLSAAKADDPSCLTSRVVIADVARWSAERPSLYDLELTLWDERGIKVETISSSTGFRSVEIKNGRLLINGRAVIFKGVNLHEFHPDSGYVVDEETMQRDFELLKAGNFNAIRTSHYPQPTRFYELADQYGFYVVGEANLETHLFRFEEDLAPARKPEWAAQMLDRTVRMVERDKNHPSIVIWSPGNETGPGPNIVAIYDWVKSRDPSRLFQYADDDRFEGGRLRSAESAPVWCVIGFSDCFLRLALEPRALRTRAE